MNLQKHPGSPAIDSRSIIGRPILQVGYAEKDYDSLSTPPRYKTDQADVHMVDLAVRFYFSADAALEIYWNTIKIHWDEEYLNYGIKARVVQTQTSPQDRIWNVSQEGLWQDVIGHTITNFSIYSKKTWVESPTTKVQMDYSYPKTIAVSFSNSKVVYITATEYGPGHRYNVVRGITGLMVTTRLDEVKTAG